MSDTLDSTNLQDTLEGKALRNDEKRLYDGEVRTDVDVFILSEEILAGNSRYSVAKISLGPTWMIATVQLAANAVTSTPESNLSFSRNHRIAFVFMQLGHPTHLEVHNRTSAL